MPEILPGTTVETGTLKEGDSRRIFSNIFAGGGLMLSQVCTMTGLEVYDVQNWVKRGYVSKPKNRMYSVDQFARIVTIRMLRESLQIDKVEKLLSYINGQLDDASDDLITDSELYHRFVSMLIRLHGSTDERAAQEAAEEVTRDYREVVPGARKRLIRVLVVMTMTYCSAQLKRRAELIMNKLD